MSIHRPDLPNAPYRIRTSRIGPEWTWTHYCPNRPMGIGPKGGRAPTHQLALVAARVHSWAHLFDRLTPVIRLFGGTVKPVRSDFALWPPMFDETTITPPRGHQR